MQVASSFDSISYSAPGDDLGSGLQPISIAFTTNKIFVLDNNVGGNSYIQRYTAAGAYDGNYTYMFGNIIKSIAANATTLFSISTGTVYKWSDLNFGGLNALTSDVSNPQGMAADANYVYVADSGNSRIKKFNNSTGALAQSFGTTGFGDGKLKTPWDVDYDSNGRCV